MSAVKEKPAPAEEFLPAAAPDPKRFVASKKVLLIDAFMTHFIKTGGVLVVVAVIGIFVFIVSQVIPLFQGAKVIPPAKEDEKPVPALPAGNYSAIDADEWSELPIAVREDGSIFFVDMEGDRGIIEFGNAYLEGETATAIDLRQGTGGLVVGTDKGKAHLLAIEYEPDYGGGKRVIREKVDVDLTVDLADGVPVTKIGFGQSDTARVICAEAGTGESRTITAVVLEKKRSLLGGEKWSESEKVDLTSEVGADQEVQKILVTNRGDSILLILESGQVEYFFRTGNSFALRQKFVAFENDEDRKIAQAEFLLGDVSVAFVSESGLNRVFSLYRTDAEPVRQFHPIKNFPQLEQAPDSISAGVRNKAFLLADGNQASLRYLTTEAVRWSGTLPFQIAKAMIGGKYETLLFLDEAGQFHRYDLDDPHPESGAKALFGKVWYEGSPEPKYEWQSTGGSDDFEPKLSLVPLIFGTLKGTLYAMLFAVPVAIFGAMYTSQFLHPNHKAFIKPVMEIMASLPSVVLGFLAALWLAPLIEDRVPSIVAICILVPSGAFLLGWLWSKQPRTIRKYVKEGLEFLVFMPFLLGLLWLGWQLGPVVESIFFTVTDSVTGERVADFKRWWPEVTGASYEQRNSLVVGFIMGFAVIPIIFTIAEDSLSNVPGTLRSGSLALGASRWQTAWRIVLPTASAGIFSALMIGLGRAVGETMIVVMATGNTPIMEWNIFSGMRTLSANIAVELPEAPHHGTLYRTLFLGAVVLFLMTFAVNTVAEVLRQHLREKYKTV